MDVSNLPGILVVFMTSANRWCPHGRDWQDEPPIIGAMIAVLLACRRFLDKKSSLAAEKGVLPRPHAGRGLPSITLPVAQATITIGCGNHGLWPFPA
jgi:hypothetical protein